jgi:hypothetical protein
MIGRIAQRMAAGRRRSFARSLDDRINLILISILS